MKKRSRLYAKRSTLNASSADFLLEIGTEELPAAYLNDTLQQLHQAATEILKRCHVAWQMGRRKERIVGLSGPEPVCFATPRRLGLFIPSLSTTFSEPPQTIRGPSKQAAYDANGKPTHALNGFLKSRARKGYQIREEITEKGATYIYLVNPSIQVVTEQILPEFIGNIIVGLRFPKTMRWDASGVRFARPVRWLLALFGDKPIRVTFGALTSSRVTWVGGPKRPTAVTIKHASQYFDILKRHGIAWNQTERRAAIERFVRTHAKQHQGKLAAEMLTHGLLDEVTYLVEKPTPLYGQFDRKYLALPREVLLASMAKHQRVFAMQQASGALLPKFVAILDGKPRKANQVCHVYEHILNARLADAMLFWEQDRQRSLNAMATQVAGVTFHEKLGSMAEKQARLHKLSAALEPMWSLSPAELQHLRRACELTKADLVSAMVKEFPTLQGVMGKYYALQQGEPREVADAIEEHYLPLAGKAPNTLIGRALSVLDKYDTLASYFSIGIEPTGDQDPFGLRRAAQGIVEVAWNLRRPLQLDLLFARWQTTAPFAHGKAEGGARIRHYLLERFYTFDWPAPAPSRDLIDAVLVTPGDDLVDAMGRIQALQSLDGHQALLKAAKVIERTHNILKSATVRQTTVDQALLKEPLECTLWDLHQTHEEKFLQLIQRKSYQEATEMYGAVFFEPLHEFFDKVMVNVQNEALQQNRLALLRAINALYTERVADLSKLVILQTS